MNRFIAGIWMVISMLGFSVASFSEKVFDFNTSCQLAYQEIIQLKLNAGQRIIDQEKIAHPDNLIPFLLENYIDFFTLLFNEDPEQFREKRSMLDKRIIMMNEGPQTSPFYLFSKSIIYFQWAAVRMKFGYNWDAGWQFRRSFLLIRENREKFPGFAPALFYNGAMKVAADAIPDSYRWLTSALGVKADRKLGFEEIEEFLSMQDESAALFKTEALFYYLFLRFYMNNERQEVFDYISSNQLDMRNNHLFAFLAVSLNINNQQSENALKIINEITLSPDYLQTPVWDLEMGYALVNRLDDQAPVYLERFLKQFKGDFYVKDALQKLGWYYYLKGDSLKAEYYRGESLKKGELSSDADKLAQHDALKGKWPNKLLLQARMLNDGGYYREALELLQGKRAIDFLLPDDKLEFLYRVARLYDDTGRQEEAIVFYKQVITTGEQRKEHYAARSAIQLGNIYEKRGEVTSAVYWFNRCLDMKDHYFKTSLDQRAKSGLARLGAAKN